LEEYNNRKDEDFIFPGSYTYKECYDHAGNNTPAALCDYWCEKHQNGLIIKDYAKYIKGRVLDIGCAFGANTVQMAQLDGVDFVVGIDVNKTALDKSKDIAHYRGVTQKTLFRCIDFVEYDFADGLFDSVVSFHTLEHIYLEHHKRFIRNIWKALKKGGYLLLSIPYDHAYGSAEHVSFFIENNLNRLLMKNGFKRIECYRADNSSKYAPCDLLNALYIKR